VRTTGLSRRCIDGIGKPDVRRIVILAAVVSVVLTATVILFGLFVGAID
jgi:hypothetical protein